MWINRGVAYWRDADRARRVRAARLPRDPRRAAVRARRGDGRAVRRVRRGRQRESARRHRAARTTTGSTTSRRPAPSSATSIVVGSSIADTLRPDAPPGDVRAFDVRTGALRWTFHTIPHPGEPGAETWETGTRLTGAANVWSTITADLERGWCSCPSARRAPTSTAAIGSARTSTATRSSRSTRAPASVRWHFQTVHHDLWDYDLAAPPVLVTLRARRQVGRRGRAGDQARLRVRARPRRPARRSSRSRSGRRPRATCPASAPGRRSRCRRRRRRSCRSASARPISTRRRPSTSRRARERLAELRNDGLFTPPSLRGSLVYPFTGGGANWSGAAWDPVRQRLVVPVQNLAHVIQLDDGRRRRDRRRRRTCSRSTGSSFANLCWLLTGRGTGERYRLEPDLGAHRCSRTTASRATSRRGACSWPSTSRAARSRGRASTSVADDDPGGSGYGPALVTASGLVFHGGTQAVRAARARHRDTARASRPSRCPRGCTPARSATSCGPTASSSSWSRRAGTSASARQLGDYVIAYALPD